MDSTLLITALTLATTTLTLATKIVEYRFARAKQIEETKSPETSTEISKSSIGFDRGRTRLLVVFERWAIRISGIMAIVVALQFLLSGSSAPIKRRDLGLILLATLNLVGALSLSLSPFPFDRKSESEKPPVTPTPKD